MKGFKHLVQCHCVLPQYRNRKNIVYHKFVVFSLVDDEGEVVTKFSQCNNCDVVHRVIDFCKSEISHGVEDSNSVITIDDIRPQLDEKIINVLESNSCDLATWENVQNSILNEYWDEPIVIAKDKIKGESQIKLIILKSEEKYLLENHVRQDEIVGKFGAG
tara:strand:- start:439 stop:921 length:483 start_codon:yes stop_codon:yes gene_type:complete